MPETSQSSLDDLLHELATRKVSLAVVGDRLHFKCPPGALTAQLRAQVVEHREPLIQTLRPPGIRRRGPVERAPFLPPIRSLFATILAGEVGVTFTNSTNWAVRIRAPLDLGALARSFESLRCRHSILSAAVRVIDGEPWFVYGQSLNLGFEDHSRDAGPEPGARVQASVDRLIWQAFDLDREPLFRPFIVKVSDDVHIVGFVIHHLIADALSVGLLARDLFTEYVGVLTGVPALSDPAAPQYSDYLLDMNDWVRGPLLRRRLEYWKKHLQGARSSCLPADFDVPPDGTGQVLTERAELDTSMMESARLLAGTVGATAFSVFFAVHLCTLRHFVESADLVTLIMYHGRHHPALHTVIGAFHDQLPLRFGYSPELSFRTLAREIHHSCLTAYEQQVPYGYILHELISARTPHVFPEFNFLDRTLGAATAPAPLLTPGVAVEPQPTAAPLCNSTAASHPFHVTELEMDSSGLRLNFRYLDVLYRRRTALEFLGRFVQVARTALDAPDTAIASL